MYASMAAMSSGTERNTPRRRGRQWYEHDAMFEMLLQPPSELQRHRGLPRASRAYDSHQPVTADQRLKVLEVRFAPDEACQAARRYKVQPAASRRITHGRLYGILGSTICVAEFERSTNKRSSSIWPRCLPAL
jgi:hypothetical protein